MLRMHLKNLHEKTLLNDTEIIRYQQILRQTALPSLEELSYNNLSGELNDLIVSLQDILGQTVESLTIERIKEHSDISEWVEKGISIHEVHNSTKCEFCDQDLPIERLRKLAAHFNEADRKLKNEIDQLAYKFNTLQKNIDNIKLPDEANLYEDFRQEYTRAKNGFNRERIALRDNIGKLKGILENKKQKTTEVIETKITCSQSDFIDKIEQINQQIKNHNYKKQNLEKEKGMAEQTLEKHYLSEIKDEVDNLETEMQELIKQIHLLENGNQGELGIKNLESEIELIKSKVSSHSIACDKINNYLKTFLGREEIIFKISEDEEGYIIKRHGKVARKLSESEKTAITFIYFVIDLQEQNFNMGDGIIVIDDPISSLDSNSIFQAFAFLKKTVTETYQIFIFTHNFEFLKLLLNWLKHHKKQSNYYMIKNKVKDNRNAYIDKLDELLEKYESEYQYLFKILNDILKNTDDTIDSVYNAPNIARKLLETFLMFKVPNNNSTFEKLNCLSFDENKKNCNL